MATTELDMAKSQEAHAAPGTSRSAGSCGADELKSLLAHINDQIQDADRRHSDVLRQMQERLAYLSEEARNLRSQAPEQYSGTMRRIEGGMTSLAERVAEVNGRRDAAQQSAPMPLRSAAGPNHRSEPHHHESSVDTFEVLETSRPGDANDPWDEDAAEALMSLHESGDTGYVARTPDPEAGEPEREPEPAATVQPLAEEAAEKAAGAPVPVSPPAAPFDKAWLGEQISALAVRLEQSLADINPDDSVVALAERFTEFESRLASALEGVATRSDMESIALIESNIGELADHVESAQAQLSRLEAIELQLQTLVEQISTGEGLEQPVMAAAQPTDPAVMEQLVSEAVERAASRVQSLVLQEQNSGETAEFRAMMDRFIDEQRTGDEHMATMLDTMQQALIRVLDRMDAMEMGQMQAPSAMPQMHAAAPFNAQLPPELPPEQPEQPAEWSELPGEMPTEAPAEPPFMSVADVDTEADASAVLAADMASIDAALAGAAEARNEPHFDSIELPPPVTPMMAPPAAAQSPAPAPARLSNPVEKLRQDFKADAQRAKDKAMLDSAQPATAKLETPGKAALRSSGPKSKPRPASGSLFSNKRGVIVAGLALILAIMGGMLLMPRSGGSPDMKAGAAGSRPETGAGGAGFQDTPASSAAKVKPQASAHSLFNAPLASSLVKVAGDTPITPASLSGQTPPSQSGVTSSALDMPPLTVGPLSLRMAAAKGDPSAEFEVGSRLAEGKGTDQSFKEALRWYQRSATRGFAQAQYRLGTLYERGLGTKADLGRARIWYQRAAEQGNVKAMHNLAVLSAGAETGTPDYPVAARWFREAAERNLSDSQYNLAVLLEGGLGVEKNLKQAYKWFSLAAAGGDREALRRRDLAKAKLPPNELAEAEALVKTFVPMTSNPIINDARAAGQDWKKRQSANSNG